MFLLRFLYFAIWVVYGFLHFFSFFFFFCCLFYAHVVMLFHFESEVYFNILNMHQLFIWSSLLVMVLISFVAFFFFFFEGGPGCKGRGKRNEK